MYFTDWVAWGRIKHTIILDDPFDDPAGLADLIPEKSPELKPPADVMFIRSCVFPSLCLFGRKNLVHSRSLFLNG